MSIFDSYRIIPKTYTPDNRESISYVTPSTPKKPLVSYNALGEPIGLTWREGDPIWLEFNTEGIVSDQEEEITRGMYISAEQYLEGKIFQLTIYDFRYNVIATADLPAGAVVRVPMQEVNFSRPLIKGVYKLNLNLLDTDRNNLQTLINGCQIFII